MAGYVPLFSSLTTGTLCGKWPDVGLWPIVLSLADRHGVVDVTPGYLSRVTGLPVDDVVACMQRFCQPDPASRSTDTGGARLQLIDPARGWGWTVVNHGKYRERARKQAWDAARTASGDDAERKRKSRRVPTCPDTSRLSPLSNTNTNTNTNQKEEKLATARAVAGLELKAFDQWIEYRKEIGKPIKPASLMACAQQLAALGAQQADAVKHSIANGYQGLFTPTRSKDSKPITSMADRVQWRPEEDDESEVQRHAVI